MARRDQDTPEQFGDYPTYLDTHRWPSYDASAGEVLKYVDEMPPQYAAAALAKLRRWAMGQYADDLGAERYWAEVQRRPLARALMAKATSVDDLTEALEPARGYSTEQATHIVARMMLEGASDDEDVFDIAKKASRAVTNMYKRGFVVLRTDR
jgi:hypothetical protein